MTVVNHHWQLPATLGLGEAFTLTLRVNAWKRPNDKCLQVSCDQEIDWQKAITWQRQKLTWHGSAWETSIVFWAHAPGENLSGLVTLLPADEIFPLPKLSISLPEQQLPTTWLEDSKPAAEFRQSRTASSWLIISLMVCGCGLGIGLEVWRRQKHSQLRQSLRRLSLAAESGSVDLLHQATMNFFVHHSPFAFGHDLRQLALSWWWRQTVNANLSPSLLQLADQLERHRFQRAPTIDKSSLTSYCHLAAHIIKNYQPEDKS